MLGGRKAERAFDSTFHFILTFHSRLGRPSGEVPPLILEGFTENLPWDEMPV